MSNTLWYAGLAVLSFICAVYAIYRNRSRYEVSTLFVFYLFSSSITWIGEFIVLGLFNSYEYKTGLIADTWAQNLMGHLFLNTTMFPAAGILVVVYSLRFKGMLVIAAVFTVAEYIFHKLGIYEQHWWRYYMSVLNVFAFMLISRGWFYKMTKKRYGAVRAITFYFVAMLIIHIQAPLLLLFDKQNYQWDFVLGLVKNYYLASTIIAFVYHLIESFILVLFTCILKKWYWKLVPLVISPAVQVLFAALGILNIREGWSLVYSILIYEASIIAFLVIEELTLKPVPDKNPEKQIN